MATRLARLLKDYGVLFAFLAIIALECALVPKFGTSTNLLNIVRQSSIHGIMAVGMTFVILTGGIDLSVASLLALTGVLCASLAHHGWPVGGVIAAGLGLGALMGLCNGLLITLGRITPFVVTLGTMSVARGLANIYTGGKPISGFDETFRFLGAGDVWDIPVPIYLFGFTVLAAAVVLRRTRLGRYTYAIGGNVAAARLSGIAVKLHTTVAYVLCGMTAGLAALVLTARLNAAESIAAQGYELDVIASVVIGGTSLMGGRGSVWGTLLGALLIGVINNSMNLLGIESYWQPVTKGAIIIVAALLDRLRAN